jgi:Putative regulator of cell autolysis
MNCLNANLLYHIGAWILIVLISLFSGSQDEDIVSLMLGSMQFFTVFIALFYLHYAWLIPRYLMNRRYLVYAGFFLLCIPAFPYVWLGFHYLMSNLIPQVPDIDNWLQKRNNYFTQAAFCMIPAIAVRYAVENRENQRKARALAHEKDRAELSALRAQANPHFLFNAFNSLYALSLKKDERLPEVILKLSDLMRYLTDYSQQSQAPLAQEIKLIQDYLEIQQLRLDADFDLQFTQCGTLNGKMVTPLLLLPLVENCFKHGDLSPDGFIHLDLKVEEQQITFQTRNLIEKRHETNGTGLENLQRLLTLKYNRHYNFEAGADGSEFHAYLNIPLNGN